MAAPIRTRTFQLADGEVAAIEAGDPARPIDVIFLHANGFNAATYRRDFESLADRMRILAIDQRGHGRTTLPATPDGRGDWTYMRDDLLALAPQFELGGSVVLAGHSMGGTVSVLSAADFPIPVKALALFDPVFGDFGASPHEGLIRLQQATLKRRRRFASREAAIDGYQGKGAFATWPRRVIEDYLSTGLVERDGGFELACAPEWEAMIFMAYRSDWRSALARYAGPVAILKAEFNSTCRLQADAPEITGHANRSLTVVEGASHFLPMERPDLVEQTLLAASLCA